jgi:hypothetical protein
VPGYAALAISCSPASGEERKNPDIRGQCNYECCGLLPCSLATPIAQIIIFGVHMSTPNALMYVKSEAPWQSFYDKPYEYRPTCVRTGFSGANSCSVASGATSDVYFELTASEQGAKDVFATIRKADGADRCP